MSLSSAEVKQLRSLLSKVTLGDAKRRKRKRRGRGQMPTVVPVNTPTVPVSTPSRRRRRKNGNVSNIANAGEVTLSRTELLTSVDLEANKDASLRSIPLLPSAQVMSWLYKISQAFDRIVWLRARVIWKPCVGTMANGSLVVGVDWASANSSNWTRSNVQALTPTVENAVWQSSVLPIPQERLMTRRYYSLNSSSPEDRQPGAVVYHLKGPASNSKTPYGDLWIEYTVRLSGTQS